MSLHFSTHLPTYPYFLPTTEYLHYPLLIHFPFQFFFFYSIIHFTRKYHEVYAPSDYNSQFYKAFCYFLLLSSNLPLLYPSSQLTLDQFSRLWIDANATARDLLVFMWYTKDIILSLGYMELLTSSLPFYLSRLSLRANSLCMNIMPSSPQTLATNYLKPNPTLQ